MSRQVTNNLHGTEAFWEADTLLSGQYISRPLSLMEPKLLLRWHLNSVPKLTLRFPNQLINISRQSKLVSQKVYLDFLTKMLYAVLISMRLTHGPSHAAWCGDQIYSNILKLFIVQFCPASCYFLFWKELNSLLFLFNNTVSFVLFIINYIPWFPWLHVLTLLLCLNSSSYYNLIPNHCCTYMSLI